jgi:putative SOS response-associated peptidase YedK
VCGRYAAAENPDELVEVFEIEATEGEAPGESPAAGEPDWNVAPTKSAPVVLERAVRRPVQLDQPELEPEPAEEPAAPQVRRWLRRLRWGLVPSWSGDTAGGARMINARAETLLTARAFRKAALVRRCLVPAGGWYEWQPSPTALDARGKPAKQAFYMRPADGQALAFAGIYEFWRDPMLHPDDPNAWLTTYAIITTRAEPALSAIHDRMPLALPAGSWDAWLDPALQDADAVRALLQPPAEGRFEALPVSNRVNSAANNGPELIRPVPPEQLHGVIDPATGELVGAGDVPLF